MLEVQHLNAGAARRLRLVLEARDGFDLLGRLVAAHGARLLAYCVMHTHLHLVVEGPLAEIVPLTNDALWGYTQSFNRRHGLSGPLLRGPVTAIAKHDAFELMRTIDYVHDNPTTCDPPIVERAVHFEWSSARAFAGLSLAAFPNVARARALLGRERVRIWRPELADLDPVRVPSVQPHHILVAAAQTYGVDPSEMLSRSRAAAVMAARATFVRVGRLEAYDDGQLAPDLGRSRQRIWQIGALAVDERATRIARTLLRHGPFLERVKRWSRQRPSSDLLSSKAKDPTRPGSPPSLASWQSEGS
jgi:hypothetical protein